MNKVRVGVVGCGEIAQIAHLPYLKELPEFEVGAICDVSPKVLQGVGDRFGVAQRYLDYRDMVAQDDLEAAVICNRDHADPAIAAMKAGLHVLVEKPMAFNLEQADEMIAAAGEMDVRLMVGYMKRFDPAYDYALRLIKDAGDVRLIRVHDYGGAFGINRQIYDLIRPDDLPPELFESALAKEKADLIQAIGEERADFVDAYNQLLLLCSHDANLLQEVFGPPERILCSEIHDELFVTALLDYGGTTRCVWETGVETNVVDWDEQFVVYGNKRIITINFPYPYLKNAATRVLVNQIERDAFMNKHVVVSFDEAFKREWRHFYDCVTEDKEPITNGEKARADIDLLINLVKSARQ
jgi:predicted dehydrogenase